MSRVERLWQQRHVEVKRGSVERLQEAPLVYLWTDALDSKECDELVKLAAQGLRPAKVTSSSGLCGDISEARSARTAWLYTEPQPQPCLAREIAARLCEAVSSWPPACTEDLQVAAYAQNGEYRWHYDAFTPDTKRGAVAIANAGQRLVTLLGYLNDVEEGGTTDFWSPPLSVKPKKGSVLIFFNCLPGTDAIDVRTLHMGSPVVKGEKWIFNLWLTDLARTTSSPMSSAEGHL